MWVEQDSNLHEHLSAFVCYTVSCQSDKYCLHHPTILPERLPIPPSTHIATTLTSNYLRLSMTFTIQKSIVSELGVKPRCNPYKSDASNQIRSIRIHVYSVLHTLSALKGTIKANLHIIKYLLLKCE